MGFFLSAADSELVMTAGAKAQRMGSKNGSTWALLQTQQ